MSEVQDLIKGGKEFLVKNDFDGFFKSMRPTDRSLVTKFLLDNNYDFLSFMTTLYPIQFDEIVYTNELVIPSNIEEIEFETFLNSSISDITLSEGLKVIQEKAFLASSIEEIRIPSTCVEIHKGAFANCRSLKRVFIPESVTLLPADLFFNCEDIKIYTPKRTRANMLQISKKDEIEFYKEHIVGENF